MKNYLRHIPWVVLIGIASLFLSVACSTKKNTASTRFWHGFTARFNTYFNGHEAYKEGCLNKETGHRDDFTQFLPLFTVGNEKSRLLGSSSFETTIEKCEKAIQLHSIKRKPIDKRNNTKSAKERAWLNRKEFNPFLKNAWLLMGKAQFQKGDFLEAAATFSYVSRLYAPEPLVATEARVWLARSYAAMDWYYDAEDALNRANRDSMTIRIAAERDATSADLLLRQGRYAEALPFLERTAAREKRKQQRARLYFLLGQVQQETGNGQAAYKAFKKCVAQNPTYELAFNARIRQAEVLSNEGQAKKMITRLRRMARNDNNKEYLDQVYYAMGNIYLMQKDTAQAISAYEKGREKSTRNGLEKGVLLLRLAGIYWEQGRYDLSQKAYADAIGVINKDYDGYEEIARRSRVLDALVPHTSAIHLQDSLLALSVMDEEARNEAIDRVIEELKRQDELKRRAQADSAADARMREGGAGAQQNRLPQKENASNKSDGTWYFYNTSQVIQGKQDFQRQWGKRPNEDDWRRSNRTVIDIASDEGYDYEAEDSIMAAEAMADSATVAADSVAVPDSIASDPYQREYYLQQIPFSEEAKQACHEVIKEALYQAAIIEKDQLEDFPLAARTFQRLMADYPDFAQMEDVYHHLFLLYSRWGQPEQAATYRQLLAEHFPESAITRVVTDPDFEYHAIHGRVIEDSLYAATYVAYREEDTVSVARNFERSTRQFPNGLNRPKFIFVYALSRIGREDSKAIAAELRKLVEDYPQSDVSEPAGMIVIGLESGRTIVDGNYDLGSLWTRRSSEAAKAAGDGGKAPEFTPERNVPFACLIAYPTDSIDDNQLLYRIAHFNFTGFMVRNFETVIHRDAELTQFQIDGFNSFDEVHRYAQHLYANSQLGTMLSKARVFLISRDNLKLIGTAFSFEDYQQFYDQHFAPLDVKPIISLDREAAPAEQIYEDELPETPNGGAAGEEGGEDGEFYDVEGATDDEGEWFSE